MTFAYHLGTFYLFYERSLGECNFENLLTSRGWLGKYSDTGKYDHCDCLVGRREHEEHPWWTNAAWISPTTGIKDDIYKHRSLLTQTRESKKTEIFLHVLEFLNNLRGIGTEYE